MTDLTFISITLGDRHGDWEGRVLPLAVPSELVENLDAEDIAEAFFEATNAPVKFKRSSLEGTFQKILIGFSRVGVDCPALSVGDLVNIAGVKLNVLTFGFREC